MIPMKRHFQAAALTSGEDFLMLQRILFRLFAALCLFALPTLASAQSSYTIVDVGLLSGTAQTYPTGISNNPNGVEVIGKSLVKSGVTYVSGHAFYWSQAAGIVDIGVLGADVLSSPRDINVNGEVVGSSFPTSSAATAHPLYWNLSRGARNPLALPTLSGGVGKGKA